MTSHLPLADVKILDLMWAMAGPAATRMLADYGATVVRVESTRRFDATRTVGPFHRGQPSPESSGLFYNMNTGKHMLTLDLAKEAGRAVMLDLVRWADVVTEAFSPKAMRAWGFDYESLRQVKPDIIMLSTCLMGQSGPLAQFAGFGNLAAAISGFTNLAGWPDRPPAGPFGAYTDYIAPWFNAAAILAALDYRHRTGQGQHIDLSQAEASLHFLGPALLDYTVNDRVWQRDGNRDLSYAPHGIYPAAGTDRWIAIAVTNNEQWQALCAVMGRPDLLRDERCATPSGRLAQQAELDAQVAAWTKDQDLFHAEAALQAHGVPASAVRTLHELSTDPQLVHRGHFVELAHPTHGKTTVEGSRFRLSRTPAQISGSAATLGRDNQYVLQTILGYSEEQITELVAAGVLE
ncbi:MAG TPA: CoA transferase [Candidatus Binatia bacterium]|jgi:benzylsuccinate CoA-transferase BbsF subunit|nr:CoA transferase [Candidatus Binatia bacterium]